jgi:hypothetical protein
MGAKDVSIIPEFDSSEKQQLAGEPPNYIDVQLVLSNAIAKLSGSGDCPSSRLTI